MLRLVKRRRSDKIESPLLMRKVFECPRFRRQTRRRRRRAAAAANAAQMASRCNPIQDLSPRRRRQRREKEHDFLGVFCNDCQHQFLQISNVKFGTSFYLKS
jgi:hypothetical protein|tara:strand:- start:263 stop:568 length:306 start_codon:yes stop_codon:yes gene_type:complete